MKEDSPPIRTLKGTASSCEMSEETTKSYDKSSIKVEKATCVSRESLREHKNHTKSHNETIVEKDGECVAVPVRETESYISRTHTIVTV